MSAENPIIDGLIAGLNARGNPFGLGVMQEPDGSLVVTSTTTNEPTPKTEGEVLVRLSPDVVNGNSTVLAMAFTSIASHMHNIAAQTEPQGRLAALAKLKISVGKIGILNSIVQPPANAQAAKVSAAHAATRAQANANAAKAKAQANANAARAAKVNANASRATPVKLSFEDYLNQIDTLNLNDAPFDNVLTVKNADVYVVGDLEGQTFMLYNMLLILKLITPMLDTNKKVIGVEWTPPTTGRPVYVVQCGDQIDAGRVQDRKTFDLNTMLFTDYLAYISDNHFVSILGNHEIDNALHLYYKGKLRLHKYTHTQNAEALSGEGKSEEEQAIDRQFVFGQTSILGRIVLRRPLLLKLNDVLFSHAGVSDSTLSMHDQMYTKREYDDDAADGPWPYADLEEQQLFEKETADGLEGLLTVSRGLIRQLYKHVSKGDKFLPRYYEGTRKSPVSGKNNGYLCGRHFEVSDDIADQFFDGTFEDIIPFENNLPVSSSEGEQERIRDQKEKERVCKVDEVDAKFGVKFQVIGHNGMRNDDGKLNVMYVLYKNKNKVNDPEDLPEHGLLVHPVTFEDLKAGETWKEKEPKVLMSDAISTCGANKMLYAKLHFKDDKFNTCTFHNYECGGAGNSDVCYNLDVIGRGKLREVLTSRCARKA
jgi:Calcineurin-like phosphoesterase